ncbi:hypothetical protein GGP84_003029 [Salinibacter ruber]|uniref:hypothetical protein n=1 Tax=Salinibacter ruber TaxID=146919 RepID=UPI002169025F|nr:hypothetical protein [Salinibacter ruber]MCS3940377.1 hypothetical protein [Salinibacter ruber]
MDNSNPLDKALSRLDRINMYTPKEVGEASEGVGLYAWYSIPNIGKPDWEKNIKDGEDKGRENFENFLGRHTNRHKFPPFKSVVEGTFSQRLEGVLEDESYKGISGEKEKPEKPVLKTINSAKHREKMVETLSACTPLISSPIYIGVSNSLRERLMKHVSELRNFQSNFKGRPIPENIEKEKTTFAFRAAKMGFTTEHLYVITLGTSGVNDDLSEEQVRTVSEALEWFLNRWHKPFLGRE